MKKVLSNLLTIVTALAISSFTMPGCDHYFGSDEDDEVQPEFEKAKKDAFNQEMDATIEKMFKKMMAEPETGDPDLDFAHMMIHHHEGGIEVGNIELKYGYHAEAKEIAQKSNKGNLESKKRLETYMAEHGAAKKMDKAKYKLFREEMMMHMEQSEKVLKSWPATIDADYDFAEILIHHHQGALEMSELELKYGKDKSFREEAQMMIMEQEMEIKELGDFRLMHKRPVF